MTSAAKERLPEDSMQDAATIGKRAGLPSPAIGARLDRLPVSAFHWKVLGLIAGGLFFDGFDVYIAGGVLGALAKIGFSTPALNATFVSMTLAGMSVGAAITGILGDRLGRRYAYQANLAVFGIASLAGAAAPNMETLIFFRFIMGVGLGAEIVISYGMLSEFVPPQVRGKWAAALAFSGGAALLLATLSAYLIIPNYGWRWMFVIAGIGALIMMYLRKAMPESPRWLQSVGRTDEAEQLISQIEQEIAQKHPLPDPDPNYFTAPPASDIRLFLRQPVLNNLIIAIALNIVIGMALYGFIVWIPSFLIQHGLSVASSLGYSTLISLGAPFGCTVAFFLSDSVGRKPGLIGASLLTICFGYLYGIATNPAVIVATGFMMFTLIYFMLAVGIGTYANELFDTPYRLRGAGIGSMFGRGTAMITPFIVIAIFNFAGLLGVITLFAAELLVLIVILLAIGVETNGKPLEKIIADEVAET
jgi:MFS transporter, putative metabolite:H+ symporter